jgi:hypothetical protein
VATTEVAEGVNTIVDPNAAVAFVKLHRELEVESSTTGDAGSRFCTWNREIPHQEVWFANGKQEFTTEASAPSISGADIRSVRVRLASPLGKCWFLKYCVRAGSQYKLGFA